MSRPTECAPASHADAPVRGILARVPQPHHQTQVWAVALATVASPAVRAALLLTGAGAAPPCRLLHLAALAVAMHLCAAPAVAQVDPPGAIGLGTRPTFEIPSGPGQSAFVEAIGNRRATLRQVAACIAARRPRQVDALLAFPPDTPGWKNATSMVLDLDCFIFETGPADRSIPTVDLPVLPLRGALFEAMYRRKFGRRPPSGIAEAAGLDYAALFRGADTDTDTDTGRAALALARFGDCLVREATDVSRALLETVPDSARENRAIETLRPTLALCVDKGAQVTLSRSTIRGAISEGLYRLSGGLAAS